MQKIWAERSRNVLSSACADTGDPVPVVAAVAAAVAAAVSRAARAPCATVEPDGRGAATGMTRLVATGVFVAWGLTSGVVAGGGVVPLGDDGAVVIGS